VIAGFNTDIEFGGTVYHIQTEDKGAPHRMVMSLVYDKGTILASKRSTYEDLVSADFDEKQVAERVSRQHKLMCAAVKAGRISELVEMTRKSSAYASPPANGSGVSVQERRPSAAAEAGIPLPSARLRPLATVLAEAQTLEADPISVEIIDEPPPPEFFVIPDEPIQLGDDVFEDLPIIDAVAVVEDVEIVPEAVKVVSELAGQERKLHEKLTLEMLGESKFKGGDRKTINLMLCRGSARKVVPGAQIIVKVLGSAFRPVIFHARSDVNGLAKVHLQLPRFSAGRAALLIRALHDGQEIELRKVVMPG